VQTEDGLMTSSKYLEHSFIISIDLVSLSYPSGFIFLQYWKFLKACSQCYISLWKVQVLYLDMQECFLSLECDQMS